MKEILRDQYHTDISVMAAFLKQVAHLFRINVIYQIVEDHEALSAMHVKIFRYVLVESNVFPQYGQLLPGDSRPLAIAPYYPTGKMSFGAQGIGCRIMTFQNRWVH